MPEFIAEIGSNWYASGENGLERAKKLIKAAAMSGADVAKFQLFRVEKLYREKKDQTPRKHLELPLGWIPELVKTCDENGLEFFLSVFYPEAVDETAEFVSRWKIASWDMTYKPLLEKVASTMMPVVMSTGAADFDEVDDSLSILTDNGTHPDDITLLHCTGGYPTRPEDMQLKRILDLATEFFPAHVGLSSHCTVPYVTAASVLYGAEIIEVHFDLKDKAGAEANHSYTPQTFSEMVKMAKTLLEAKDCGCVRTLDDAVARNNYYRDESDWLRPVLNPQ